MREKPKAAIFVQLSIRSRSRRDMLDGRVARLAAAVRHGRRKEIFSVAHPSPNYRFVGLLDRALYSLFTISNLQCNVNKSSAPEWPSSLQLFIMPRSPVIPSYWISIFCVIFTIEEVSPCKKRSCCCTHGTLLSYSINHSKTGTFLCSFIAGSIIHI